MADEDGKRFADMLLKSVQNLSRQIEVMGQRFTELKPDSVRAHGFSRLVRDQAHPTIRQSSVILRSRWPHMPLHALPCPLF